MARGTLSDEERYKITSTSCRRWSCCRNCLSPNISGKYLKLREDTLKKIDGSGYPRRLTGEQMSPLARMIAVAGIFEALTAVDRPYKTGKTLSEAIAIMSQMQHGQHIDPDVFALFLRSGAYLDYARRFMQPKQTDAVDVDGLLDQGRHPAPAA
ncbi:HD domain-containing phosphohydrolase [Accumulibacter sp.]|uniref:HD domain-containing phosphohydrolase n=1 Tax=Accumulibacter sp. TaxID=2053492 RepID=UPI00342FDBD4